MFNVESVSGSDFTVANTSFVNPYDEATYNWYQYHCIGNRSIISGDTNGRYFMKQAGIESENTLGFGSKLHNACSIEYPNRS